ncbi:MAG: branched-chain amino acid transporter permease [Clostridia bacterium]|nr:branched-chain amino acid transporter permease [Clostridia bacterium]
MNNARVIAMIAVISAVTVALRFLPFLIFGKGRKTPPFLSYLGRVLPYAIMGMLVVYCLRGVTLLSAPHGLPEAIASATVVLLHVWRRNTLLSILGGTVVYMLLVQLVF